MSGAGRAALHPGMTFTLFPGQWAFPLHPTSDLVHPVLTVHLSQLSASPSVLDLGLLRTQGGDDHWQAASPYPTPCSHSRAEQNPFPTPYKWTCEHGSSCLHQAVWGGAPGWDLPGTQGCTSPKSALPFKAGLTCASGSGALACGKRSNFSAMFHPPPQSGSQFPAPSPPALQPLSRLCPSAISHSLGLPSSALLPPPPITFLLCSVGSFPGAGGSSWASELGSGLTAALPAQPGDPDPFTIQLPKGVSSIPQGERPAPKGSLSLRVSIH